MNYPKLYVLVRTDMPWPVRAVQAGHAVAEYMKVGGLWKNNTLVYLRVKNLQELTAAYNLMNDYGQWPICYKEPDFDLEMTAFAFDVKEAHVSAQGFLDNLSLL
jgi:hypothetical protein